MENKILEVLREHPTGLRLREIVMYLRVNRFSIIRELDDCTRLVFYADGRMMTMQTVNIALFGLRWK